MANTKQFFKKENAKPAAVRVIRYENGRVVEVFEGSPKQYKRMRKKQQTPVQQPQANAGHMLGGSKAKSYCHCGHTGDGEGSQHAGAIGHGGCLILACQCRHFTWARFITAPVKPAPHSAPDLPMIEWESKK